MDEFKSIFGTVSKKRSEMKLSYWEVNRWFLLSDVYLRNILLHFIYRLYFFWFATKNTQVENQALDTEKHVLSNVWAFSYIVLINFLLYNPSSVSFPTQKYKILYQATCVFRFRITILAYVGFQFLQCVIKWPELWRQELGNVMINIHVFFRIVKQNDSLPHSMIILSILQSYLWDLN